MCQRKYYWEYLTPGIEKTSNAAAEIGTQMHEFLEAWFLEGKEPDDSLSGIMAKALIQHWPSPCDVDSIEDHLEVETEVAQYHGYKDIGYWADLPQYPSEPAAYDPGGKHKYRLRVVGDHKSTSNLQWAKTEEVLRKDPQTVIYSGAEMVKHGVAEVLVRWAYATRDKKPRTRVVEFRFTQDEVEAGFELLDVTAAEILQVRSMVGITALDLPPNVRSCDAFGGCQHIVRCTDLTPQKRMKAHMAQLTLRERLAQKKAAKDNETPAPAKVETPAVPAKAASSVKERLAAKAAAKKPAQEEEELPDTLEEDEEAEEEAKPVVKTPAKAAKAAPVKASATPDTRPAASVPCYSKGSRRDGRNLIETFEVPDLGVEFEVTYNFASSSVK